MNLSRKAFQDWGRIGGRMRARLLSKARRRAIAKQAVAAREKKRVGRPKGSLNKKKRPPEIRASIWPSKVDPIRAAAMYRAGYTLEVIGKEFGVTRERIRQILKREGLTSMEGGLIIRQLRNVPDRQAEKNKKQEKREEKSRRVWGISHEQYEHFVSTYGSQSVNTSPLCRYKTQRASAKGRGIGWEITFAEWWNLWEESGKWEQRGRGYGYAMARIGDSGPYKVGNVEIITGAQNSSDSFIVKPASARVAMGLATKRKNGTAIGGGPRITKGYVVAFSKQHKKYRLLTYFNRRTKYHSSHSSHKEALALGKKIARAAGYPKIDRGDLDAA